MLHKLRHSILLLFRVLVFFMEGLVFFLLYSVRNPFLLKFSRTSIITMLAYTMVYYLMTRVYGGFDIGKRKSRPIIYSLTLTLIVSDLVAHLFLSIMNTTIIHDGAFVYEQPLLLLLVIVLQFLLLYILTYGAHGIYFSFVKPKRSLIVSAPGVSARALSRKIGVLHKQYRVERTVCLDDPTLYDQLTQYQIIFLNGLSVQERMPIIDFCYSHRIEFYYTMEIMDVVALGAKNVMFGDTSMMRSAVSGLTMEQRIIKRCMDILLSVFGLIVTSPIMLATAIAIKIEDGGHVFYQQKRATYAGRTFNVLKFRSMKEENSVNRSVTKDDDRITKVGRVIRKFRIDELPQFINVLRSDMSFVGPRPEMLVNIENYTKDLPEFSFRFRAKAGLTGLAQVYGKYNTTPKEKLIMDLTYIEQYSVLLDIKLLLRTVMVLFTPDESTEAFDDEKDTDNPKE